MFYIIDGHNLIPKTGLRLDSIDDEEQLVLHLQKFCRLRRAKMEVFFDGAPPGHVSLQRKGSITVHYIRKGSTADAAIELHLGHLGKQAKNWTVVSSDGRVQKAAQAAHSTALSAEEFAREMIIDRAAKSSGAKKEATLAPEEVEEWLKFFDRKKGE